MAFASLGDLLKSRFPTAMENWPSRLAREWEAIVGDLAKQMRLEKVVGSTIIVGVFDSHWIQELFMLTPLIIQTINRHLGTPHITNVRFVVANKKSTPRHQPTAKKNPPNPPTRKIMSYRHETILRSIKDVQLQEALEKIFYHCVS